MNRKFSLSLFVLLLTFVGVFAQKKVLQLEPQTSVKRPLVKSPALHYGQRSMAIDTLLPTVFLEEDCSFDLFIFLNNAGWGFVGGQNEYFDLEKAQRFYYESTNYTVEDIVLFIATKAVVGDGNMYVKIYDIDPNTGGPGSLLGISDPVKASDLAVDEQDLLPTLFTFSEKPQVTGNEFFVSADFTELYQSQDTVSLFMTDIGCGNGVDTWELFSDAETWVAWSDSLSWGIDASLFMLATVQSDGVAATKDLTLGNQRVRLHDAFPNPATEDVIIAFDLEQRADIQVEIYNLDGKLIQQVTIQNAPAGQHQHQIAVQDLPSGIYFYGISTEKGRLMNKFLKL